MYKYYYILCIIILCMIVFSIAEYLVFRKYRKLLRRGEELFKTQKSVLSKQRGENNRQLDAIKVESKILTEHIANLKNKNSTYQGNKTQLLSTARFLLTHAYNLYIYLNLKQEGINKEMEDIPIEELTEVDRNYINNLQSEILFMYQSVESLNNFHFNITGKYLVKWEKNPNITQKQLIANLQFFVN